MLAESRNYRRMQLWLERNSGTSLLVMFCAQQLSLMAGLVLLIVGFSLWQYWWVFFGLLSLRGSFLLQEIHRKIDGSGE